LLTAGRHELPPDRLRRRLRRAPPDARRGQQLAGVNAAQGGAVHALAGPQVLAVGGVHEHVEAEVVENKVLVAILVANVKAGPDLLVLGANKQARAAGGKGRGTGFGGQGADRSRARQAAAALALLAHAPSARRRRLPPL
jgi:hypothetical protein